MARRTIRVRVTRTIRVGRRVRVTRTIRPISVSPRSLAAAKPPPALGAVRTSPLTEIREAVADFQRSDAGEDDREFDVFISHAGEDKDEVARPLAEALREIDLEVWYDEFELRIGDSLRRRIDAGLARSRFGVVVLSPSFFSKGWPNYELDGLVTREIAGSRQIILPIWHNVSTADVVAYSPSLAGKLARSTAETSLAAIAKEIAEVIRS